MTAEAELAVRAARAELELEAMTRRAEQAERMVDVLVGKNPEEMLDTIRLMGIPAREMKELYEALALRKQEERGDG